MCRRLVPGRRAIGGQIIPRANLESFWNFSAVKTDDRRLEEAPVCYSTAVNIM
jgi:hypothetical protein